MSNSYILLEKLKEWYYYEIDIREENRIYLRIIRNIFFTSRKDSKKEIYNLLDIENNEPVCIEVKNHKHFNFAFVLDSEDSLKRIKVKIFKTIPKELLSEIFILYFYRYEIGEYYCYAYIVNHFGEDVIVFKLSTDIRKLEKLIMTETKVPIKIQF